LDVVVWMIVLFLEVIKLIVMLLVMLLAIYIPMLDMCMKISHNENE